MAGEIDTSGSAPYRQLDSRAYELHDPRLHILFTPTLPTPFILKLG